MPRKQLVGFGHPKFSDPDFSAADSSSQRIITSSIPQRALADVAGSEGTEPH